jgi:alpha-amylase/alpha-mannosidase (GH57 family)
VCVFLAAQHELSESVDNGFQGIGVDRYICIHGHFYQPPRENPWLEAIELQDSAYPYHDWNARIDAECYAPNSASRILDGEGRIASIFNNYARISYNFGPTLLAWMQDQSPETYQLIVDADRLSAERFSGHGSALAQPYNHTIMPLANVRDRYTQVRWGIRDFERRFGRYPEGMWLPETAVDLQTLEVLAEHGIKFTVLSPYQARRVRQKRRPWRDVTGGQIDPTMPYRLRLPSRRKIALFFYDGPISRAVAFERLLDRGEYLAGRLVGAFSETRPWAQLVHIATDGETYGHHHPLGDMALSYALKYIEENGLAKLTNYGEFLERYPPSHEVQIYENTAWSCAHGIERWRSSCGCNSGGRPEWNQDWRLPLREALDWLRDSVAPYYETKGSQCLKDPWAARDDYIDVILDRSPESRDRFFAKHAAHPLSGAEEITALKLLELQRHAMLMYTSCGWFFDELSGIETVQVIQYAGRVLQLARELGGPDLEAPFLDRIECARSNIPEHRNGRVIFEKFVRPAVVDLEKVGAHYAVSSLFANGFQEGRIYSYSVDCMDSRLLTAGKAQLSLGKLQVVSEVTRESAVVTFGVAHLGDHTVAGGVRAYGGEALYLETLERLTQVFRHGELPELIRAVDREFGPGTYSLKLLFRDEQRRILREILASGLAEAESAYRHIYESHVGLARLLASIGMRAPKSLEIAAEVTLNNDLRRAFEQEELELGRIAALVEEAQIAKIAFDSATLEFSLRHTLERMAEQFAATPEDAEQLEKLEAAAAMARSLPFEVVLWRVQNIYYDLMLTVLPDFSSRAAAGDRGAREWVRRFRSLGDRLGVRVD